MPINHTLQIAKWLHAQQRPFKIRILGYASDGTTLMTEDGVEQYAITLWTAWNLDGTVRAYKVTNDAGDKAQQVPIEAGFPWIERLLTSGCKYDHDTVYTEVEARPMVTEALPLIYRKIARLTPSDDGNAALAYDKDGAFLMELTPEGAETLRAFNWNLA
jgi:hypothetical protein